jgi:hypothetical protein
MRVEIPSTLSMEDQNTKLFGSNFIDGRETAVKREVGKSSVDETPLKIIKGL